MAVTAAPWRPPGFYRPLRPAAMNAPTAQKAAPHANIETARLSPKLAFARPSATSTPATTITNKPARSGAKLIRSRAGDGCGRRVRLIANAMKGPETRATPAICQGGPTQSDVAVVPQAHPRSPVVRVHSDTAADRSTCAISLPTACRIPCDSRPCGRIHHPSRRPRCCE